MFVCTQCVHVRVHVCVQNAKSLTLKIHLIYGLIEWLRRATKPAHYVERLLTLDVALKVQGLTVEQTATKQPSSVSNRSCAQVQCLKSVKELTSNAMVEF